MERKKGGKTGSEEPEEGMCVEMGTRGRSRAPVLKTTEHAWHGMCVGPGLMWCSL